MRQRDNDDYKHWLLLREAGRAVRPVRVTSVIDRIGERAELENQVNEHELDEDKTAIKPIVQYKEMTDAEISAFKRSEMLTDNRSYQRGDLRHAYKVLGMENESDVMTGSFRPLLVWQIRLSFTFMMRLKRRLDLSSTRQR